MDVLTCDFFYFILIDCNSRIPDKLISLMIDSSSKQKQKRIYNSVHKLKIPVIYLELIKNMPVLPTYPGR